MKPCPADLAFDVLASNPGKWFAHPDLFRAIVLPDGKPLPVTTALMQRLNERLRSAYRRNAPPPFDTMHSIRNGAIEPVWLRMTKEQAAAWKKAKAERQAKKGVAA